MLNFVSTFSGYISSNRVNHTFNIFQPMFLYNVTLGGTSKAFGVIYVGLIDLFGAGELQTSLVTVIYTVCSCTGCT